MNILEGAFGVFSSRDKVWSTLLKSQTAPFG